MVIRLFMSMGEQPNTPNIAQTPFLPYQHKLSCDPLELVGAEHLWIAAHASLCAPKGDVHDCCLPGHETRQTVDIHKSV
jgi:hypothetical protein